MRAIIAFFVTFLLLSLAFGIAGGVGSSELGTIGALSIMGGVAARFLRRNEKNERHKSLPA